MIVTIIAIVTAAIAIATIYVMVSHIISTIISIQSPRP